jgi:phosphoribosylformylglycinamidine (FGAM) synthase-like enzyme
MAFAGNCGITVDVPAAAGGASPIDTLFSEEAGFVLEVFIMTRCHVML